MTISATNGTDATDGATGMTAALPETIGATADGDRAARRRSCWSTTSRTCCPRCGATLRPANYEVLTADSGEAALEILATTEVDLIVSDMRMPTMSGAAFLRRARALYPETMRVLLTGYSDIASIVEAVNEGGVYRYLNKPWDDQDLLMTLEQALKSSGACAPAARLAALTEAQNETLRRFNAELETQVRARTEARERCCSSKPRSRT
jgi:response regulator RpfG family c-di-GMP phosphodiesterase